MIMVFVSIQEKTNSIDYQLAVNGKILSGNEKSNYLIELSKKLGSKNLKFDENIYKLNNNEYYCYLTHPETDNIGRKRLALVIWDKKDSNELLESTINKIGINNTNEILNKYKTMKKNNIIKITTIVFIIVFIINFVIYKFIKGF